MPGAPRSLPACLPSPKKREKITPGQTAKTSELYMPCRVVSALVVLATRTNWPEVPRSGPAPSTGWNCFLGSHGRVPVVPYFLTWGDFHARFGFARSTILEEKWGTTRSL